MRLIEKQIAKAEAGVPLAGGDEHVNQGVPPWFTSMFGGDGGGPDNVIPGTPVITDFGNNVTLTGQQDDKGRVEAVNEQGTTIWLPPGTFRLAGSNETITVGGEAGGPSAIIGEGSVAQGKPTGAELINGWGWHTFADGTAKRFTEAEMKAAGLGTGGTGPRAPQRVGVRAPDPYQSALLLFQKYDEAIVRGELVAEDADREFNREFDVAKANADIEYDKRSLQSRVQDTATQRGQLELDILSRSLPEGRALNLGAAGLAPMQSVNIQDILTQGLPPLAGLYGDVEQGFQPITGLPDVAPIQLPPESALDFVNPLADRTAAGSSGFLV